MLSRRRSGEVPATGPSETRERCRCAARNRMYTARAPAQGTGTTDFDGHPRNARVSARPHRAGEPAAMTRPEHFANDARTALIAAIDARQTTIRVRDPERFPQQPQFRVIIDNEILIVTAGAGTPTWTVIRGAEGTHASAHDAVELSHVLTAAALETLRGP